MLPSRRFVFNWELGDEWICEVPSECGTAHDTNLLSSFEMFDKKLLSAEQWNANIFVRLACLAKVS